MDKLRTFSCATILLAASHELVEWLGRRFLNRTFSMQEDDPIVDVEEIRELFDEEIKEGGSE